MLEFLANFWDSMGHYEGLKVGLACMKVYARLHNCEDLFEYFLAQLINDDRKLAHFVMYVFKEFSRDHSKLVQEKYLPAMLMIAESD